jgi:hypothetical protein
VVGPPVSRWADSLEFWFLVEIGSKVRACKRRAAYTPFGPESYERFASGETPRHQDACDPSLRRPSTLQSPPNFRPVGCPSSHFVSVTELGTAPRSTLDAREFPPARLVSIDRLHGLEPVVPHPFG